MSNTQDPIKLALVKLNAALMCHPNAVETLIEEAIAVLQSSAPQPPGFDAHDMATAAADGFRAGVASTQASEPSAEATETEWVFDPNCKYCGGTGQYPVGRSGRAEDGNALEYDQCDCWMPAAAPARAVEPLTESELYGAYLSHVGADDALPACPPDWEGFSTAVINAFCKKNGITTTPAAKEQS